MAGGGNTIGGNGKSYGGGVAGHGAFVLSRGVALRRRRPVWRWIKVGRWWMVSAWPVRARRCGIVGRRWFLKVAEMALDPIHFP